MIGTFEKFELAFGSFGQQYSTIDGREYVTFFDLMDPKFGGLHRGARVEFEVTDGPTKLCDGPHRTEPLPGAKLLRVVREG
jgi:hypothetical protein